MTISAIGPPLVSATGTAVAASLPWMQSVALQAALPQLHVAALAAFGLNLVTVSLPGRIDGYQQEAASTDISKSRRNEINQVTAYLSKSLVAPAGWAFAIWGPIYLGETALMLSQFQLAALKAILPVVAAPWVAANVFQALWCASFRPQFTGAAKFVSAGMLGGVAWSLSKVHAVTAALSGAWWSVPLTMHFGWTTAATLVNLNGAVAANFDNDTIITATGHLSAVAATALGIAVTVTRAAPVYGCVIAWALAACGDGMARRLNDDKKKKMTESTKKATLWQKRLCFTGAVASLGSAVFALLDSKDRK